MDCEKCNDTGMEVYRTTEEDIEGPGVGIRPCDCEIGVKQQESLKELKTLYERIWE